jgi:hypothetical protein
MFWKRWFGKDKARISVADAMTRFEDAARGRLPEHELRAQAALAASFMDGTLILGSMDRAWARVDPHQVGGQPASLEARALRGARDLSFKHYPLRDLYGLAPFVLVQAIELGERKYLAWLLEALQIAYVAEKQLVAEALRGLEVTPAEVRATARRLAAQIEDGESHGRAFESAFLREDPALAIEVAEALARDHARCAALARARLRVGKPAQRSFDGRERIARLLGHDSPAVLLPATLSITHCGLRAGDLAGALAGVLARAGNSEAWRASLEAVLTLLIEDRTRLSPPALARIQGLKQREPHDPLGEVLTAFWYNQERVAPMELGVEPSSGEILLRSNAVHLSAFRLDRDHVIAAYQHVRWATARSAWSTDEDRIGLALVDLGGEVVLEELPVEFAIRPTGAAGAKRSIEGMVVTEDEVFVSITSPFSNRHGWGNQVYLVSFRSAERSWRAWSLQDGSWSSTPLTRDTPIPESELPIVGHGTLALKPAGSGIEPVLDSTAYAFEDAEPNIRSLPPIDVAPRAPSDDGAPIVLAHLTRWSLA